MADRKQLQQLLVRVEGAGGEDREADCLMWAALLAGRSVEYLPSGHVIGRRTPSDEITLGFVDPGEHSRNFYTAGEPSASIPRFTSSIDAALALVERLLPDVSFGLSRKTESHRATYWIAVINGVISEVEANSAPLAILAALLTALMQTQDENV